MFKWLNALCTLLSPLTFQGMLRNSESSLVTRNKNDTFVLYISLGRRMAVPAPTRISWLFLSYGDNSLLYEAPRALSQRKLTMTVIKGGLASKASIAAFGWHQ